MAVNTFIAYVGVYDNVSDADADYELVKDLHTKELIDSYDAAVIERRADGKVKITKKHETPTRVGGVLGGGLASPPAWSWPCSRSPPSAAAWCGHDRWRRRPRRGRRSRGRRHQPPRPQGAWRAPRRRAGGPGGGRGVRHGGEDRAGHEEGEKLEAKQLKADTADIEADAKSAES